MSQQKRSDLRKKDFLVVKQSRNNDIVKVLTPHTFQVGLDDREFNKSLIVKGSAQVDSRILDRKGEAYVKGAGPITVTETEGSGITISSLVISVETTHI